MRKLIKVVVVGMMMLASQAFAGGDLIVDGNVGIGTPSPLSKLDVRGSIISANNDLVIGGVGSFLQIQQGVSSGNTYSTIGAFSAGGNAWNNLVLQSGGGSVGIGTTTFPGGTYKLSINGTALANTIYFTSDERYKKNILPVQNALSTLLKMEGVSYEWKKPEEYLAASTVTAPAAGQTTADKTALTADGFALRDKKPETKNFPAGRHYGVLAQAMEKVLPEVVKTDDNGDKAVNYSGIIPVLIEAIKEQQAQIEQLKQQVANLQK